MPRMPVARIGVALLFMAAPVFAQNAPGPATPSASATAPAPSATPATATGAKPADSSAAPATSAGAATPNTAGTIDLMEGDVRVFDANRVRRTTIKLKDPLSEGDSVVTGPDGELHVNMQDGGYLAVRPNTVMKIMMYRANGDDADASVIGMVKGALRSVTGFIGRFNSRNYRIITPTATIGVRGTDHETLVLEPNDPAGDAGTYDKVNAGGTYIQTPQGRTEVTPGHAGFASHTGNAKPRVLASVPGFFKPTKNEHLIEGRHAALQGKLQQMREQRRQQVQQQRQGQAPAAKRAEAPRKAADDAPRKAAEAANAKATPARQDGQRAKGSEQQQHRQTAVEQQQQRQAQRQQSAAEQRQQRQAARQQAIAARQQAVKEKIEAFKKAQQQKRKKPLKEKEQ